MEEDKETEMEIDKQTEKVIEEERCKDRDRERKKEREEVGTKIKINVASTKNRNSRLICNFSTTFSSASVQNDSEEEEKLLDLIPIQTELDLKRGREKNTHKLF